MTGRTHKRCHAIVAAIAAAGMIGSVSVADAEDEIILGYVAAATGELAPYGSVPGVQCMVDIINDGGGVLGGTKLKLLAPRHQERPRRSLRHRGAGVDRRRRGRAVRAAPRTIR